MERIKEKQRLRVPEVLFFLLCLIGAVGFFVYVLLRGNAAWAWFLQENDLHIRAVDFLGHVRISNYEGNVYTVPSSQFASFPAFAYLFYRLFYVLFRDPANPVVPEDHFALLGDPFYNRAFLVYSFLTIALLFLGILFVGGRAHRKKAAALFLCLLCSAPVMGGGLYVGNSAILVCALLFLFFALRDSPSPAAREAAMLLLAVCAGFKVYPAVFGLLYIREKRYKEAIRLVLYGAIVFFVPFLFFGGAEGLKSYFANSALIMATDAQGRIQYIKGLTHFLIWRLIGRKDESPLFVLQSILPFVFLAVMLLLFWKEKQKTRAVFFLCCILVFFPTKAYRYTLSYLAIPLALWMFGKGEWRIRDGTADTRARAGRLPEKETQRSGPEDWIYGVGYGLLYMIPIVFGVLTGFKPDYGYFTMTYVELWIYGVAYLLVLLEIGMHLKDRWAERRKAYS